MEENLTPAPEATAQAELTITPRMRDYLEEARKWAYFLSIVGFIGIGLMVVASIFMGLFMNDLPGMSEVNFNPGIFAFVYLLIALLYFFPVYYVNRFAVKMKWALLENDNLQLSHSFGSLKSLFRFMGIFTIIVLSLYAVMLIIAMVAGGLAGLAM